MLGRDRRAVRLDSKECLHGRTNSRIAFVVAQGSDRYLCTEMTSTKTPSAKTTSIEMTRTEMTSAKTTSTETISSKKISTKTTSTAAAATSTGFSIVYVSCETITCPVGKTCDSDGDFDMEAIQPQNPDNPDLVEISGTYNEGGMVGGTKAKFCGQTSKFTIDGDDIKGSSSDDMYSVYTCKKSSLASVLYYDSDSMIDCTEDYQWECLTDICLD